jgi:hypothetical protein
MSSNFSEKEKIKEEFEAERKSRWRLLAFPPTCVLSVMFSAFGFLSHEPLVEQGNQAVAGVLDEPFSQLTPLSGVSVHRPASLRRLETCPSILSTLSGQHGGYSAELA